MLASTDRKKPSQALTREQAVAADTLTAPMPSSPRRRKAAWSRERGPAQDRLGADDGRRTYRVQRKCRQQPLALCRSLPGQRILVGGDVVFNNMHVYTAETDSQARGKWLNSLNTIRALQPSVVIPGHSKVGAPLDASTAIAFYGNILVSV